MGRILRTALFGVAAAALMLPLTASGWLAAAGWLMLLGFEQAVVQLPLVNECEASGLYSGQRRLSLRQGSEGGSITTVVLIETTGQGCLRLLMVCQRADERQTCW